MVSSAWTRDFYPRHGDGVAFDRVVFFSDAVFAIALTLAAVEIGLPEVEGDDLSPAALWAAFAAKGGLIAGFAVAFVWVAIYWRANHRFTMTLRGMNGVYVGSVLVYLALIAFLPIPAATLGEYWLNPMAIVLFALYGSAVSGMEVVLMLVAARHRLYVAQPDRAFLRRVVVGSLTPLAAFLTSIPLAFVATWLAVSWWFLGAVIGGFAVARFLPADPPPDPVLQPGPAD
jgi:uncharacterized membrane protein